MNLWACELNPKSWWTENLNLVRICVELLHILSALLVDKRCPHYFVGNWQLVDDSLNVGSMASNLLSVDQEHLSAWLMDNYIRQCGQRCPDHILRLFEDVSTSVQLQNAVSEIILWRLNTLLFTAWWAIVYAEYCFAPNVSKQSLTPRSYICWMNELTKVDRRFSMYFSAVALLQVACRVSRNGFSEELMDILRLILGREFSQCCGVLSLGNVDPNTSELVDFLQKSAVERLTAYRLREARDFGSIVTIVTVDFEAIYAYKRGEYQPCLQLCTRSVHKLLYAEQMPIVSASLPFSQLLDDDIVSLTALALIVDPECRYQYSGTGITQLTLSLYLMTRCQLKLRHSVASLARTLDYIKLAQRNHPREDTLDQLTLKLIERYVETSRADSHCESFAV